MTYIIIIVLIGVCLFLVYCLSRKKEIDNNTVKYNNELLQIKNQLTKDEQELKQKIKSLNCEIDGLGNQRDELFDTINRQQDTLINIQLKNENIANDAYSNYVESLEKAYIDIENEFDIKIANKNLDLLKIQKELDKLKETRAAAHEALLKEQEVKENKDNYRLLPSQADLADARRLEIVKRELNKPRILSMLIWKTYYQPIAQKQFPTILQAKTKMGIYKITNIITDECYIGQAVDIYKRWNDHCKCGLGIDTPPGNKLYKSMQEYGLENFTFELLTECKQSELNEKEKYFIELYQANIYGMNSTGGNR